MVIEMKKLTKQQIKLRNWLMTQKQTIRECEKESNCAYCDGKESAIDELIENVSSF